MQTRTRIPRRVSRAVARSGLVVVLLATVGSGAAVSTTALTEIPAATALVVAEVGDGGTGSRVPRFGGAVAEGPLPGQFRPLPGERSPTKSPAPVFATPRNPRRSGAPGAHSQFRPRTLPRSGNPGPAAGGTAPQSPPVGHGLPYYPGLPYPYPHPWMAP